MKKIFAIGDIHGCFDLLKALMESLPVCRRDDTLLFIGDYIDRGASSRKVVDYVIGLEEDFSQVIRLMGNHEQMFLRYLEGLDREMYLYNGGDMTLSDYGLSPRTAPPDVKAGIPAGHLRFFRSLMPYYETDEYIFVHAGLIPGRTLAKQDIHDLLWVRHEFIGSAYDFGKKVIFGHTPLAKPLIMPNKIGIDTGAVFGGRLTCVELPALKIYQV